MFGEFSHYVLLCFSGFISSWIMTFQWARAVMWFEGSWGSLPEAERDLFSWHEQTISLGQSFIEQYVMKIKQKNK